MNPITLEGVTFTFENRRCSSCRAKQNTRWCHKYWLIARSTLEHSRSTRVAVCPGIPFDVEEWKVSWEIVNQLKARTEERERKKRIANLDAQIRERLIADPELTALLVQRYPQIGDIL